MRFSVFAATFLASATAVLAGQESTIYVTDEITITSCHSTVTNCPARSTVTSTTSYPVVTSSSAPVYANTSAPVSTPASTYVPPPVSFSTSAGVTTSPVSLSTITISTCVPTVIYSTVTVAGVTSKPVAPSGTGSISYSHNVTAPSATATPSSFTGSASSIQASFGIGAVAAIAAFFL